ncbi:MAG: hypothetical protein ABI718_18100, partial [Acidobacteriota bacterium]
MTVVHSADRTLLERTTAALIWTASFCFAVTIYLIVLKRLSFLPPTAPIAVGRVTVEGASKARDYAGALLFYALVPPATFGLQKLLRWGLETAMAPLRRASVEFDAAEVGALFAAIVSLPLILSPLFWLITRKEGWATILPLLLGFGLAHLISLYRTSQATRRLLARPLLPFHALLFTEAFSWVLFRYVATGRRIAHIPTLFLEAVFVAFFLLLFWGAALLVSRLTALLTVDATAAVLPRFATGAMPLLLLPYLGLVMIPAGGIIAIVSAAAMLGILVTIAGRFSIPAIRTRWLLAWIFIPGLIFLLNHASLATPDHWVDLFHRGESLGPASDYLHGKVPYRDVFVLHGLMEDGFLDAGLMQLFGRGGSVVSWHRLVLESVSLVSIWILAIVLFDSIPLALATLALAFVTSPGNQRVLFEILALTMLIAGMKRRSIPAFVIAGVFSALALFYSMETGLYAMGGGVGALLTMSLLSHSGRLERPFSAKRPLAAFLAGIVLGAAPFLIYLGLNGAFLAFLRNSFVTVPSIIDAVWSLPFPDLSETFRGDLSLHSLSDFVLGEKIRFALNPLVIAVALTWLVARSAISRLTFAEQLLIPVTLFALLSQRSAMGRADLSHQIFAAFLVGPMLVAMAVPLFRKAAAMWEHEGGMARAFLSAALVAAILLGTVVLWIPDLVNARLDGIINYRPRMSTTGYSDPSAVKVAERVEAVRMAVGRVVSPGRPIFDFSNQPALYFFADRPNPTRFYQIPILSPAAFQRETIVALERSKPALVLRRSPADFDDFDGITNDLRAPAVAAYIDDHYTFDHAVRGVELWRRLPGANSLALAHYLAMVHVPAKLEVAASDKERIIFPAVADIVGASGSKWQTDLVLHNSGTEPLDLTLRYLSVRNRTAALHLGAGASAMFSNVVASVMESPGTRGSLMIEFPRGHAPLAHVSTWDVKRGGKASLESPMTAADAASADGPLKRLIVVGVSGGETKRVTLGVVSLGNEPAAFRVVARNASGDVTGRGVSGSTEEQGGYVLADLAA